MTHTRRKEGRHEGNEESTRRPRGQNEAGTQGKKKEQVNYDPHAGEERPEKTGRRRVEYAERNPRPYSTLPPPEGTKAPIGGATVPDGIRRQGSDKVRRR